jgi:hypothetical protein
LKLVQSTILRREDAAGAIGSGIQRVDSIKPQTLLGGLHASRCVLIVRVCPRGDDATKYRSGWSVCVKNVNTLWRELEQRFGESALINDVDPLYVIETTMRYFFALSQTGHQAQAPIGQVRKCYREAAQLAALAAPYRHPRLSAVKHLDHADALDGIKADATVEELRGELAKRGQRCEVSHFRHSERRRQRGP